MIATLPWWQALAGGLLIGVSAGLFLLLNGRIAGISGLAANAIGLSSGGSRPLSIAFLLGLPTGAALAITWVRLPDLVISSSPLVLVVAGLLVGFGTRLGSGCTSGHGVCGLARLSRRSLAATITFMAVAAATVFVMRHLVGTS